MKGPLPREQRKSYLHNLKHSSETWRRPTSDFFAPPKGRAVGKAVGRGVRRIHLVAVGEEFSEVKWAESNEIVVS